MRVQGVNNNGEPLSSMYVDRGPHDFDTYNTEPSLTRQEFADECDINVLMQKYETSGVLNHYNSSKPQYFDVSAVPDLATAIAFANEANVAFMSLPASVRRTFDNNPVAFVEFAADPANLDQMRKWGLAPTPDPVPGPMKVEIVNPPEAPAK